EGIRYSMSQWYPKMCEYDKDGWHAHPYIGREFYGVWGDFDFTLTIDSDYTVAASGLLQNAREVGHGYAPEPASKKEKLTWHFVAENVHDFAWAADPDYKHDVFETKSGVTIHTFHQEEGDFAENWKKLPAIIDESFQYINQHFGKFPYPTYSFIQGGDGGMEYPMATLITGKRSLGSLAGVSIHELLHSWFQMVLGFNESYYYWMDEGFTDYAETRVINHLKEKGLLSGSPGGFLYEGTYKNYKNLVEEGIEEPLSTHADHFDLNSAYSISAYVKGAVFLNQLEYVIGKSAFDKGMLDFFNQWKFKHPDDHSLIRTMEKTSGLELDWYRDYMVNSIKFVDYVIDTVVSDGASTTAILMRAGGMPMPVDISVVLKNGTQIVYSVPLDIMRGAKSEKPDNVSQLVILPDWNWVNPTYDVLIPHSMNQIESISIDPTRRLADMDESNNRWPASNP
ncbi:MAG: M1 family metallopeptidase, partial [Saprospiraceae bacterium]